jgi:DNA-binding transcriptional LysR family regulator
MNLAMLSTLAAVLDKGSFAAAASEVGCTPSAVSMQMKQLESHFGRPLFDRSARTVRPTPFAAEVSALARDVSARLDALRERPAFAVAGRVRLGAIATVQADPLPAALRALRDRHPELELSLSLADSDELLSQLKAGRIDAAVVVRPRSGGSSRLHWQDLARQPFVLLAPPDVAVASPRQLLQSHALVRYDPALTGGRTAAQYVRRLYPRAQVLMDVASIDVIVAMVAAGLGISVVPQPRAPLLATHGVRVLGLGRGAPARQIAFVRRAADAEKRNLDAVHDALESAYS